MTLFGYCTTQGSLKEVNQDACCYKEALTPRGPAVMGVVCDGVGGLSYGEIASSTVISLFAEWFDQEFSRCLEQLADAGSDGVLQAVGEAWVDLLDKVNERIYRFGHSEKASLATTFTGMLVLDGSYLIVHVGDGRVYEMTSGVARQLTSDQSMVGRMVAAGELTAEEAKAHSQRNVILQAIGAQTKLEPEILLGAVSPSATYVICTDGFYVKLSDAEMATCFSSFDAGTCERLAQLCMDRGERDNITVLAFSLSCDEDEVPTVIVDASFSDEEDFTPTTVVELSSADREDATPTVIVKADGEV